MDKEELETEFMELINNDQSIIHKVCNSYCFNEEDRKDLFQEILINLWKSYPSFRGESKFSTWMYRVSLNVAIQRLRKVERKKEFIKEPKEFDSIETTKPHELPAKEMELMHKAIKKLNDVEKAIVILYLEEKSNEDIANIIGISQNHVRVKMTRIRNKLKNIVGS